MPLKKAAPPDQGGALCCSVTTTKGTITPQEESCTCRSYVCDGTCFEPELGLRARPLCPICQATLPKSADWCPECQVFDVLLRSPPLWRKALELSDWVLP
jgi:hypothetical protein